MLRGTVQTHQVTFESLRGNWLGDTPTRSIPVYLPPDYGAQPLPVVYYLPAYAGTSEATLNVNGFEPNLFDRLDRLIGAGVVPPLILVVADGFTRYGGSQWLNSPTNGRYEDAVRHDLVAWVDSSFSTRPEPGQRAVMGRSSGGYGALVLAMQNPDVFGAVACHSGDLYFEYCYLPDIPKYARSIIGKGGPAAYVEWFWAQDRKPWSAVAPLNLVAMAAAYSPDPDQPAGVRLPFDLDTGELLSDVWQRWLEMDPVRMVFQHASALRSSRLVYLDCGRRDEYNLQYGARILSDRLSALGVPHVHEEYDDGHTGTLYRVDESLKRLGAVFQA